MVNFLKHQSQELPAGPRTKHPEPAGAAWGGLGSAGLRLCNSRWAHILQSADRSYRHKQPQERNVPVSPLASELLKGCCTGWFSALGVCFHLHCPPEFSGEDEMFGAGQMALLPG